MRSRLPLAVAVAVIASLSTAGDTRAATTDMNKTDAFVAQGFWGVSDAETGAGTWGTLVVMRENAVELVSIWEQRATAVTCDNGSPEREDDFAGLSGVFRAADGEAAAVEFAPSLRRVHARASLAIVSGTFETCTWTWTVTDTLFDVPVSARFMAAGTSRTWVDVAREVVPGEYRVHQVTKVRGYAATGAAVIGDAAVQLVDARISCSGGHAKWTLPKASDH
jgi:hypothetical protein